MLAEKHLNGYSLQVPEKYDPYKNIADDYDKLIGPRDEVDFLKDLIPDCHPGAKEILELACGSGTLLKHFAGKYSVSGIEISPGMLSIAKKTIPKGKFYMQDMTKFKLKMKFDVILCLFNSINHLNNYSEWKKTFIQSCKHLNQNGVFIFDVMTPLGLKNYSSDPDKIVRTPNQLMATDYSLRSDGSFQMHASIFTKIKNGVYSLKETKIIERAFHTTQIKRDLRKFFKSVKVLDPDRKSASANSEVLYFICRK